MQGFSIISVKDSLLGFCEGNSVLVSHSLHVIQQLCPQLLCDSMKRFTWITVTSWSLTPHLISEPITVHSSCASCTHPFIKTPRTTPAVVSYSLPSTQNVTKHPNACCMLTSKKRQACQRNKPAHFDPGNLIGLCPRHTSYLRIIFY